MTGWTVVTDGTAVSAALGRWLLRHGGGTLVEARGETDLEPVVAAKRQANPGIRITVIADRKVGAVDAREARRAAEEWLGMLSPIDARTSGADIIQEYMRGEEPGSEAIRALLLASLPILLRTAKGPGRRRGRPRGLNPFHGSGFEVCAALLLDPRSSWTLRGVAREIQRAPSLVQRAFGELERRGLVQRKESGIRIDDPLLLRNTLLQAWKDRVGAPRRDSQAFVASKRKDLASAVSARAQRAGARCVLAGSSALDGPAALVGDPLTVYCDTSPRECLAGSGFEPAAGPRGDLVVWVPPEPAVFWRPRTVGGHSATNRLVAFLDLAASGSQRHLAAAEAVWQSED